MIPSKLPKRAEAGAVIGGYELVRRVGRGGMAEVWIARKALGKKGSKFVALKLIVDHHVGDERYARMFRAEAELAALLSHANIVQVFDEGEDEGRSYLVMEWVDGLNLLKLGDMLALVDDDHRRFRAIAYIIGQLLHALHYAHSITSADGHPLGVVHRDVSPQNVLVSNHGEVKLTDFGVAYYNIEESSGIHVKGKVRYMSPEQLGGKTRSPTVDLYAVGALLHELLDGKKFRGSYEDGQELFAAVLSGHVPPLSRPAPPELDRLRLGLLEADPKRRIQTAEQALAWLRRYPHFGDARDELTKLCGSLTGIVKPRAGPGQSSLVPAAEQVTTRWGGRKAFAKAQSEAKRDGALPLPPRSPLPSAPSPSAPSPRVPQPVTMGSTTAPRGGVAEDSELSALITGQTEIMRPLQLPERSERRGPLAAPVVSGSAPTVPLQVSTLRSIGTEPETSVPGGPRIEATSPLDEPMDGPATIPARGREQAGARAPAAAAQAGAPGATPLLAEATQALAEQHHAHAGASQAYAGAPQAYAGAPQAHAGAPAYVPEHPSSPIGVYAQGVAAPSYVPMQGSHPLSVGPEPGWLEPGSSMPPMTQLPPNAPPPHAGYAPMEPYDAGSEPEPYGTGAMGEGTDTRREARGGMASRSTSVSIMVPRRSMVAVVGVGLVLVALLSVGVTWWLFGDGRDAGTAQPTTEPLAANVVQPAGKEPAGAEAKDGVSSGSEGARTSSEAKEQASSTRAAEPVEDAGAAEESARARGSAAEGTDEDAAREVVAPETDEAPSAADTTKGPSAADTSSGTEEVSTPVSEKKPVKPPAKAWVKITSSTGLEKAEVRLGSQAFKVSDRVEHRIAPGSRVIRWRRNPSEDWQKSTSYNFRPGKHFVVHVSKKGPIPRDVR